MITADDLKTLSDASIELYSPDLTPGNFVEHAFRFLSAVTATDQINYGNLDPRSGGLDVATSFLTPNWHEAVIGFGEFMMKYPFFCFDPKINDGEPFFRSDFISSRQFRDLDIFQECFRVLGMLHHAAVHVPTDDGRLLWFGVERSSDIGFSERDRVMLSLARQHLAHARRLAYARHNLRGSVKLTAKVFEGAGFAPRESEVSYWLTEGKSNAEIALIMKVQLQTVKGYVATLFNKTGTGNRLALTLHLLDLARVFASTEQAPHCVPVRARRRVSFPPGLFGATS